MITLGIGGMPYSQDSLIDKNSSGIASLEIDIDLPTKLLTTLNSFVFFVIIGGGGLAGELYVYVVAPYPHDFA